MQQLMDRYQRKFHYLRLSIIDACNFKCNYCLPNGYQRPASSCRPEYLSLPQIDQLVQIFSQLGTSKVRLTGGEPSIRRDFTDIIACIAAKEEIKQLVTTTNGYKLAQYARYWREAGLTGINVSIDSLKPEMFNTITGVNQFHKVMRGVDTALEQGFDSVKINAVLMRGYNLSQLPLFLDFIKNKPVELRLIELMQTGDNTSFFKQHFVSGLTIKNYLFKQGWVRENTGVAAGPAQVFSHPDYLGKFGLILPYEKNFCASCNRLRVSSTGRLHLCLFGEEGVELQDLLGKPGVESEIIQRIEHHLVKKRQSHYLGTGDTGITPHLAAIGG